MSKATPDMTTKDIDDKFWRAVREEKVSIVPVPDAACHQPDHSKDSPCQPLNYN